MGKWCNTCHRNELKDKWNSCRNDCPIFGKDFDDLAEMVIKQKEENDALRWTNKHLVKVKKEKCRELWDIINRIKEILLEINGVADSQEFGLSYSQAIGYLEEIKDIIK